MLRLCPVNMRLEIRVLFFQVVCVVLLKERYHCFGLGLRFRDLGQLGLGFHPNPNPKS